MTYKSDYAEERKALRKAINAQNKRRGKQMERRVAKYLGGHTVPMSGAGAIKGDGMVQHERVGYLFIECKMSAAIAANGEQRLLLQHSWLDKMQIEAEVMNARFPILVFHHHGALQDYVLIRTDHFIKYFNSHATDPETIINNSAKKYWPAIKAQLERLFGDYTVLVGFVTDTNTYILCTLRYFKELLDGE